MKNLKYVIQAAVVIAIALAFIMPGAAIQTKPIGTKTISTPQQTDINIPSPTPKSVLFEDDFESYDDFVLDFPPWTQYDGNGEPTWGFESYTFPNMGYIGAFIIFVPEYTEPPLETDAAHSGEKYAACFDEVPVDPATDDWLITPQLTSGDTDFYVAIHCVNGDSFWLGIDDFNVTETAEGITINFWAKTGTDLYEPDRFQVGVSTKTNNPDDFVMISPSPYVEPPVEWTLYSYDYDFAQPELEITVAGGLGVTATVENTGTADATNVEVSFTFEGGLILLPSGGIANAALGDLTAGASQSAKVTVFGIGKPTITIDVTCDEGITASTVYEPKLVFLLFVLG
jgi:hypothetical protein